MKATVVRQVSRLRWELLTSADGIVDPEMMTRSTRKPSMRRLRQKEQKARESHDAHTATFRRVGPVGHDRHPTFGNPHQKGFVI